VFNPEVTTLVAAAVERAAREADAAEPAALTGGLPRVAVAGASATAPSTTTTQEA
jgi:malate dehydrogenase (oxaloacetate-decarboxylating)